jgi:hypothetical protein
MLARHANLSYKQSMRTEAVKPRCKCGDVCEYYGPVGGFSVQCKKCNKARAMKRREKKA